MVTDDEGVRVGIGLLLSAKKQRLDNWLLRSTGSYPAARCAIEISAIQASLFSGDSASIIDTISVMHVMVVLITTSSPQYINP